jgi:hypothetical protein
MDNNAFATDRGCDVTIFQLHMPPANAFRPGNFGENHTLHATQALRFGKSPEVNPQGSKKLLTL